MASPLATVAGKLLALISVSHHSDPLSPKERHLFQPANTIKTQPFQLKLGQLKLGHPPFGASHYRAVAGIIRVYAFELMHVKLGWQEKFSDLESNGPCTTIYWTMCNMRSYQ